MNTFTKNFIHILFTAVFLFITFSGFFSCQKAVLSPYSNPDARTPNTITPPTFSAEVNNSSGISFTPVKIIEGNYITLEGISTHNTITISLPVSLGPGHYFIGTGSSNIRATVTSGSTTYVNDANVPDAGDIDISSIDQGKYTATFSFFADDSTSITNSIDVFDGSLTNL